MGTRKRFLDATDVIWSAPEAEWAGTGRRSGTCNFSSTAREGARSSRTQNIGLAYAIGHVPAKLP
jgi:hypothetical protein